ncbi:alpha/beta hydrolase [Sinorhizobium meliloti]|uniref:alpha/beta fold hydrolase n=1 Tax=Sinorhizobium TaxID=28105 RepID=UPI0003793094|nr:MULTISPECIES: alpha/beta hydrolase [Sinorhizobium]ARS66213.1 alpha/beta hydrolase [Sinorhizobium meliloti RU11/001]MDE3779251.1 alpha/beta hydrolase [Sinorhizobium meliloti]MDE3804792.1 alpha/beta hydrolase [Sinorhizobium meliloti]MDE4561813.1 alpha/beta hydrolase [Sinorhizobium meliloti SM11]RVG61668.1 alpha/beta hydrolase [Sinorhizobium meliloti]
MKERFLLHTLAFGADQFSFHVGEYGSEDEICILLHGFGEGGYVWYDLAARLPKKYRAIIVDFRGHGNSREDPTVNYGIDTYSDDVLNLIQEYKLKNISLIGHSLGAVVALRVAAAVPYLVSNLVLVDFSLNATPTIHGNILSQFHEQCDGYNSLAAYAAWILDKRPLTHPRMLRYIVENALRETADGRFVLKADRRIQELLSYKSTFIDNYQNIMRNISCRTLLIRGKGSAVLCKKEALHIVNMLKNGQLCEISGAGHAVMIEDPDEFVDAVTQFLLGS